MTEQEKIPTLIEATEALLKYKDAPGFRVPHVFNNLLNDIRTAIEREKIRAINAFAVGDKVIVELEDFDRGESTTYTSYPVTITGADFHVEGYRITDKVSDDEIRHPTKEEMDYYQWDMEDCDD